MKGCYRWTIRLVSASKHRAGPEFRVISLIGLFLLRSSTWAASYTVQMTSGLTFSPNTMSIGEGDSVTWTNVSSFAHTSTSGNAPTSNGLWGSGTLNAASNFTVTFTNFAGGSYPYFCSFHWPEGMTGTLTITNATVTPPTLSAPSWQANQFQFTLEGMIGQSYVIESSSNLSNWFALSTNLETVSRLTITEPAVNQFQFYRVKQGP